MTSWGPERNPTVGAALVADTEYPGVPRSCFGAESNQTSRDNKAEIKGPISRQRGVMRGFKTGLRGEESDLLQPKLFPWLLRAFVGGNGGTPADGGKVQPPVRESPTFSGEEQDVDGNPSGSPWVQLSAWGGEGGTGNPQGCRDPSPPQTAPWDAAAGPGVCINPHTGREMAKWGMRGWSRQGAGNPEDAPDPRLMSAPAAASTSPRLIPT